MKVKIIKIYRSDKNKAGQPFVNKNGNAFERIAIQTDKNGDKWLGGFSNETNKAWNVGDSVDIDITEDGRWLNFKEAKTNGGASGADFNRLLEDVFKIDERVIKLEKIIAIMGETNKIKSSINFDDAEEIPF